MLPPCCNLAPTAHGLALRAAMVLLLLLLVQVCHELPAAASQAIFKEAFRLLRPGGALAVMVSTLLAGAGPGRCLASSLLPSLPARPPAHTSPRLPTASMPPAPACHPRR